MSNLATCPCGKEIIWIEIQGRRIPIDKRPVVIYMHSGKDPYYMPVKGHINHFVTCPMRDKFRKKKK